MKYVLWGEIQQELDQWLAEHKEPIRFLQALMHLCAEGRAHDAQALPVPAFDAWDGTDMDEFHSFMDQLPVSLAPFLNEQGIFAPTPGHSVEMDVLPLKIASHQKTALHAHHNFEIFYVLRGNGELRLTGGAVPCGAGTLCLVAPGLIHDVQASPDSEVISLAFWRDSLEGIVKKLLKKENIMTDFFYNNLLGDRQNYVCLHLPVSPGVTQLIRNIFLEGYSGEAYAKELCATYVELLFTYAIRACGACPAEQAETAPRGRIPMAAVMKYLREHYRTTSLAELAAVFHYEPDYLGRKIKACMGAGCSQLILRMKTEEAKRLLTETQFPMQKISELCGFGCAMHFSRIFKQKTGMTPRDFRRQKTEKVNF